MPVLMFLYPGVIAQTQTVRARHSPGQSPESCPWMQRSLHLEMRSFLLVSQKLCRLGWSPSWPPSNQFLLCSGQYYSDFSVCWEGLHTIIRQKVQLAFFLQVPVPNTHSLEKNSTLCYNRRVRMFSF